jgi:hypothetical protein
MSHALVITPHDNPDLSRAVHVGQATPGAVEISIPGYGKPIYLELDDHGEPVVYIFAEEASEDHTHKISLAHAKAQAPPA